MDDFDYCKRSPSLIVKNFNTKTSACLKCLSKCGIFITGNLSIKDCKLIDTDIKRSKNNYLFTRRKSIL